MLIFNDYFIYCINNVHIMFKYIGIRGHRGAGKNTISYLLGVAIDFYLRNKSWVGFDEVYNQAVSNVIENEDIIDETNFRSVFFEAFSDTPKITLAQIIGIPSNWTYNDWKKDSVIIDLYDFSYIQAKSKLDLHCLESEVHPWSAKQLKEFVDTGHVNLNKDHVYITLRELITYYSKYVMQGYFGQSIWVKSLENCKWETERFYTGRGNTIYKIFTDCKFPTEISYIKNNEGIIVKVNRYSNTKENTDISEELESDNRFDFEINLSGDLHDTQTIETIKSIFI